MQEVYKGGEISQKESLNTRHPPKIRGQEIKAHMPTENDLSFRNKESETDIVKITAQMLDELCNQVDV